MPNHDFPYVLYELYTSLTLLYKPSTQGVIKIISNHKKCFYFFWVLHSCKHIVNDLHDQPISAIVFFSEGEVVDFDDKT